MREKRGRDRTDHAMGLGIVEVAKQSVLTMCTGHLFYGQTGRREREGNGDSSRVNRAWLVCRRSRY